MTKYLIICASLILGASAFPNLSANNAYNGRIVGGQDSEEGQFPYSVSLRRRGSSHFCGGCIVNEWTIITAAHCIRGVFPLFLQAVVGTTKLSSGGDRYQPQKLISHPSGDIGLVILESPIQFSDNVRPVHNLESENNDESRPCIASGWGQTGASKPIPDNHQWVKLRTISNEECRSRGMLPGADNICTFTKSGEGTCFGDSGGPLVEGEGDAETLVGAVSSGEPCAIGYPDVFTRVSYYFAWIKENTKN